MSEHEYPIPARGPITLDDDVMSAFRTYPNGCNFRLLIDGESAQIEYGCYFLFNLARGPARRLYDWMKARGADRGPVALPIRPDTLVALLERQPCGRCGGFKIKERP